MNKIIYNRKLKAHLVISFILFILIFSSFVILPNNDEDYILLNKIFERTKIKNPDKTIVLNESNSNEYVISIINQLNSYEKTNSIKLDSLKNEIGIVNNAKFNSIFNQKEYSYLISQKSNSKWNFDKIGGAEVTSNSKNKISLYVSKPIYTKNSNYSLVYINNGKTSKIVIYEKIDKGWKEYKIISPMLRSSKVSLEKK